MKVEYLADIGTLDITLKEGAKSVRTDEIAPDFLVDIDEDGEVISIEILNAGTRYDISSLSAGGMLLTESQVGHGTEEARR